MNYNNTYYTLIDTRKQLNRKKNNDGLLERHHITPKSIGGTNDKENMVLLTPREHYIAHWLLYKMFVGKDKSKMAYAFFAMCRRTPNQRRTITSKQYERAKKSINESCSGKNHPNFGKQLWSDNQKKQISIRQMEKTTQCMGQFLGTKD